MNNKNNLTNWDLSLNKVSQALPDPYGFNTNIIESADANSKRRNISLVKTNKAQELAYGQFKTIFTTLFLCLVILLKNL